MPEVRVQKDCKEIFGVCITEWRRGFIEPAGVHHQSKVLRPLRHGRASFPLMPRPIQIVWLVLCAVGLSSCGRVGDTRQAVEAGRAKAIRLYEQRDYLGAISAYEAILRIQPNHPDAEFQIALIFDRNLNDYLNASYHYQRFLQSADPDTGKVELAKSSLENARLQFASSIPNAGGQGTPELVKLRTENAALHRQVEDLKREMVRVRGKPSEPVRNKVEDTPLVVARKEPKPPPPSVAHPKTYTVRKGEGIQAIAEKVYGDKSRWHEIMAANPQIKDPRAIKPGQVLVVP